MNSIEVIDHNTTVTQIYKGPSLQQQLNNQLHKTDVSIKEEDTMEHSLRTPPQVSERFPSSHEVTFYKIKSPKIFTKTSRSGGGFGNITLKREKIVPTHKRNRKYK
jgi:hypothetical protein